MNVSLISLHIDNILSFKDEYIDFNKLSVIVGPNASGKSNLIKVLNFIHLISNRKSMRDILMNYFKYYTMDEFFYDSRKPAKITISFIINNKEWYYELEFNSSGTITGESMHTQGKIIGRFSGQTSQTYMFATAFGDDQAEGNLIKNYLQKIASYSFISDHIRNSYPISLDEVLSATGTNLASILHILIITDRDRFIRIEKKLKNIFPFIESLNITPKMIGNEPQVSISIKEIHPDKSVDRINIADGTLRILAFLTALELDSSLISFEEPENCIHTSLFDTLIDVFKKSDKQIILTTHSPYLLSKVEIDQVRLFNRIEGATKVSKITNIEEVKNLLEEGFPLGEIWYMERLKGKQG